jgi:4'-phosphopantetheinyl transferase
MTNTWSEPPKQLCIEAGEVHIWRAELQVSDSDFMHLSAVMSREEQLRASRYRSPVDAHRFVLAHAALRQILSSYLDIPPAELAFVPSAHNKPFLANAGAEWLQFNLSRSGDVALFALAREMDVGIDIEQIQPELANWQLARAILADGELRALQSLDQNLPADAFFACWTRKEAYLKGRGSGLSASLDSFEVPVAGNAAFDEAAPVVNADGEWWLRSLNPGHGFAAACTAPRSDFRLKLWQWAPAGSMHSQAA